MSTPSLRKLFDLPLGSWFRYQGQKVGEAFILIERTDCGIVTHAGTVEQQGQPWPGQGIFSAADSPREFQELLVEFVPVQPVPKEPI